MQYMPKEFTEEAEYSAGDLVCHKPDHLALGRWFEIDEVLPDGMYEIRLCEESMEPPSMVFTHQLAKRPRIVDVWRSPICFLHDWSAAPTMWKVYHPAKDAGTIGESGTIALAYQWLNCRSDGTDRWQEKLMQYTIERVAL